MPLAPSATRWSVPPNIDALAARGTRFTNAYAQNPVCSPSRCSFMSGWYPLVRGHRTLTHLLQPDEPNLLRIMKNAGYHVVWAGRRGDTFGPGVVEESTDYYGWDTRPEFLFEFSNTPRNDIDARTFFHGERKRPAPCLDFDETTTRSVERLLSEGLPEPWLLLVTLIFPHPPFEAERPWFGLHEPNAMPPPARKRQGPEPAYLAALRDRYGTERADTTHWQKLKAVYYDMVTRVDSQLGRVQQAVDDAGQSDRTATVFFTDHGEYLGDYGLAEKWPAGMEDCLLRNPLIIAPPGGQQASRCDAMVELVDLLPTCLDWAATDAQHTHFGRSLVPLLASPEQDHKPFAISQGGFSLNEQHLLEQSAFPYDLKAAVQSDDIRTVGRATALRTADWTYVHRPYDCDELYDRQADPDECRNLIDDADYRSVLTELRGALLDFLSGASDVIPWEQDPRF
ncbi:MAG: sulfatase-like hydrolase/transferase [Pseudomonadota bacterium]